MPIWGQVELLCRAVAEEGRKEAERILSQARAEVERTLSEARERAEEDAAREMLERRSVAHAEARRIVDSAELEARKRIMALRERLVQDVFEALRERLKAFRIDPAYGDFLVSALFEGIQYLSGSSFIAEMSAEDIELVKERVKSRPAEQPPLPIITDSPIHPLTDSPTTATDSPIIELKASPSIGGGVRVYTGDGHKLYDNSLSARLKRREADIRQEIWRSLFGAERKAD